MGDGKRVEFPMRHNARAATVGTPRTAGKKRKAIATQAGHDAERVAWGEGEGNGLLKCKLWSMLVESGVCQAGAAAVFESVGEPNETVDS